MRKTKRRMVIPLAIPLVAHLAQTPKLDRLGPVHPRAHHIITRDDGRSGKISTAFYRLLTKAGLVEPRDRTGIGHGEGRRARRQRCPLGFHSFRHTATTMLRDAGASQGVAMELIGHASATVHRHYTHLGTDTLRRAVSLLPAL
jgi:integrase